MILVQHPLRGMVIDGECIKTPVNFTIRKLSGECEIGLHLYSCEIFQHFSFFLPRIYKQDTAKSL